MINNSKPSIEVFLKGRKEPLTFGGLCTEINYTSDKMCTFKNTCGENKILLAAIPYDNILYIRNYPYMKAEKEEVDG